MSTRLARVYLMCLGGSSRVYPALVTRDGRASSISTTSGNRNNSVGISINNVGPKALNSVSREHDWIFLKKIFFFKKKRKKKRKDIYNVDKKVKLENKEMRLQFFVFQLLKENINRHEFIKFFFVNEYIYIFNINNKKQMIFILNNIFQIVEKKTILKYIDIEKYGLKTFSRLNQNLTYIRQKNLIQLLNQFKVFNISLVKLL